LFLTFKLQRVCGDVAYAFISVKIEELCNLILFTEFYRYTISLAPSKNGVGSVKQWLFKTGA
ncbi:hypothetical protein, partial [Bartonella sp. AP58NXGY]|uniref:hypothetical protein n=1 Tax=Bartonella sp. AP58NXGY TaxID=3243498 RepID=UPI0035CE9084